jgi:CubicO group peptidase (beta-lactamase class C family)
MSRQSDRLDALLDEVVRVQGVPGLATELLRAGTVEYRATRGVVRLDGARAIDARTRFHVASVTKTFTATAVLQLVERGALTLSTRVVEVLPYFALTDGRAASITIEQLLHHTAGLPAAPPGGYGYDAPAEDSGALERLVRSLAAVPLAATPGERFLYSDLGFDVLGAVVAQTAGESYEDYIERHLLRPLGLNETAFHPRRVPAKHLASPHRVAPNGRITIGQPFPYHRAHAPCGTLLTTAGDLLRWGHACLRRGELNGVRLLAPSTVEAAWRPAIATGRRDASSYGWGWFSKMYRGRRIVFHGGWDLGFRSGLTIAPDDDLVFVVLSNFDWTPILELCNAILDVTFDEPVTPLFATREELPRFSGRYADDAGSVRVVEANGALRLCSREGEYPLLPLHPAAFLAPFGEGVGLLQLAGDAG